MVDKMMEVIPKDVPIVPSLGNNDIYPHNVLAAGPNRITEHFLGSAISSSGSARADE
jgi:endopolyphosphatase